MKILVVDIETTGFSHVNDAIVEIGISIVDTDTHEIKLVFDHVIKDKRFETDKHKDSWIFQNTTLKVEDVENANTLESYFDEIQKLFDQYPMTAFNKAFDLRFLRQVGFVIKDTKCLMHTATQYSKSKFANGKSKWPSVEEIYNQFFMKNGDVYSEEHRAGADTIDVSKVLLHMVGLKKNKLNEKHTNN